jgi:hypothetical protein
MTSPIQNVPQISAQMNLYCDAVSVDACGPFKFFLAAILVNEATWHARHLVGGGGKQAQVCVCVAHF